MYYVYMNAYSLDIDICFSSYICFYFYIYIVYVVVYNKHMY